MANETVIDPEVVALFEDSEDEGSFDGFNELDRAGLNLDNDSDLDLDDLETEEDDTDTEEEEACWTDQLVDLQVPEFVAATGINLVLNNPNELDIFLAFIADDLWDKMVEESNRYAHQKLDNRSENFRAITRAEMKAFIGINIIMGIDKLPAYALYWSTDEFFGNPGIKRVMAKNRFEQLSCYLHFNDSSKEPARGTRDYDRLFKVRTVLDYVRAKCSGNFLPTKNISVDEGMVGFRGRLSFKQYMPAKPTKYGIKVWMAADSSNGYVLNFDVYLGKEPNQRPRIYGLGYDVVTSMIRPFMNKNHHVYFDNFFSSVKLLEHLASNDTYACATVRSNRKDLPPCAKDKLGQGQKLVHQKGNVVFTRWHDKRDVSIISSNCSPLAIDLVVNKQNQQISKPAVVDHYNKHMGGVDFADQLRSYYSIGRSSYTWYKYLFWFLIDISICNSFILYNHHRREHGQGKVKQLNFRMNLAKQLIGGVTTKGSVGHSAKRRKIENLSLQSGNAGFHFIVKIDGRKKVCIQCKKLGRKTVSGRSIETSFQCLQCSIALCKTCFQAFHSN